MEAVMLRLRRRLSRQPSTTVVSPLRPQFNLWQRMTTEELLLRPARQAAAYWRLQHMLTRWKYYPRSPARRDYLLLCVLQAAREQLHRAAGRVGGGRPSRSRETFPALTHLGSRGRLRAACCFVYLAAAVGLQPAAAVTYFQLSCRETRQLAQLLAHLLQHLSFAPTAAADAPAHERAILKRATEGVARRQLRAAYELIEALERDGRGVRLDFPVSGLVRLLAGADYALFRRMLQQQTTPYSLALYLADQPVNLLERLGQDEAVRDPWLLVELLRRLVDTERRDQALPPPAQSAIRSLLTRLHLVEADFFHQAVRYFQRSPAVNTALGALLVSWPVAQVLALLKDGFGIDRYALSQPQRSALLLEYTHHAEPDQLLALLTGVTAQWEHYVVEFSQLREEALFEALQTDYWEYVCNYYRLAYPTDKLLVELTATYESIRWLSAEWHFDETQFIKSFYLRFTRLLALARAYHLQESPSPMMHQLADNIEADLTFATIEGRHHEGQLREVLLHLRG